MTLHVFFSRQQLEQQTVGSYWKILLLNQCSLPIGIIDIKPSLVLLTVALILGAWSPFLEVAHLAIDCENDYCDQ